MKMSQRKRDGVVADELPREATLITEAFLEDVLRTSERRDDIAVDKYEIKTITKPGDSFLSSILSVCVVVHDVDDSQRECHLLIKIALEGDNNFAEFSRQHRFYATEENVYVKLFPSMEEVQQKSLADIKLSVPRFYFSLSNSDHEVLVLEDLSRVGYTLTHSRDGLNFDQCKLVVKELAKFHALGYALKEDNVDWLKEKFDFLFFESYLSHRFMEKFEICHTIALRSVVQLVKENVDDTSVIQRVEKLSNVNYLDTMRQYLMPESPFATICHGDTTSRNMLFKHDSDGMPVEVKFLDFQLVRYAVPTTDLAYFIYQSTDGSLRKLHQKELLRLNHVHLIDNLNTLHVRVPELTLDVFRELCEKTKVFGILYALVSGPLMLGNPEDVPDFLHEPNSPDLPCQIKRAVEKSGKKMRILDLVYEAMDAGFL